VPIRVGRFLQPQYLFRVATVLVLYLAAGKLGLSVPFTSGNVSPVWPAAGISIAAVLAWGYEIWPGIAAAAFLVNFLTGIPPLGALGIAIGTTCSALSARYLLLRVAGVQPSLIRLRDVLGLIVFAALISTTVAATIGTTTLFLTNVRPWSDFVAAWRIWWFGDAMGVLIVAPLLLTGSELRRWWRTRPIEFLSLLLAVMATSVVIFSDISHLSVTDDVLAFAVFPFVIWAAIRFHVVGASAVSFLIATIAVWGTSEGYGPFVRHNPLHNAILLQLFLAVTSATGLVLAAVMTEREHISEAFETGEKLFRELQQAQTALREAHDELELRVRERTAELAKSNQALLGEVKDRIQAQEALEWQTLKLREQSQLLDLANDAIFIRSLDGTVSYWNEGAERLYRWSRQEAQATSLETLVKTEFPIPLEEIKQALFRDGSWEGEITQTKRDGTPVAVASRWTLWRDHQGTPLGWLQINSDVTQRKQAELALRELSGRLLHLQDEERRRLARELHDSTGQNLAALQMNLAVIRQRAPKLDQKASQMLLESMALAEQLVQEMRTISYLLHPPLLDEAGLDSALRWYVDGVAQRSNIKIDLELSPQLGRFSQDLETAAFRIVQECLTNIHRHSGSSTATIRISKEREGLRLTVRDRGKGIPPEVLSTTDGMHKAGVGIRGMRERVRELGGSIRIAPANPGTIVEVVLPILPQKSTVGTVNGGRARSAD